MKLPPWIEALVEVYDRHNDTSLPELVLAVAHEACRLQREADIELLDGYDYEFNQDAPLVVEKPE